VLECVAGRLEVVEAVSWNLRLRQERVVHLEFYGGTGQ